MRIGAANYLDWEFDFLFTYLKCPALEATNYRAEQAIRPAAVIRKVLRRQPDGVETQQILLSVLRSSRQQGKDPVPTSHRPAKITATMCFCVPDIVSVRPPTEPLNNYCGYPAQHLGY